MYFLHVEECFGSWKTPEDCEDDDCKYSAEWCASGDEVIFVVRGPGRNGRVVGIGFSMDNTTVQAAKYITIVTYHPAVCSYCDS